MEDLSFEHPLPTPEMLANLGRMREAVEEYMIKEGLVGDASFCEISKWTARGEPYLNDSLLVLLIDGSPLHTIMNYGGDQNEFDDLVASFGFYGELGYSWCLGFYPLPVYDYGRLNQSYSAKLRDPRWKAKADLVKSRANNLCQDCGADAPLDAHHCYYMSLRSAREPWEYPLSAFRALCRPCHGERERAEIRMRAFVARLTRFEMDGLRDALDDLFLGHEQGPAIGALKKLTEYGSTVEEIRFLLEHSKREQ